MKQIPSLRILATHLNYDCLPKSIFKNKAKVGFFLFPGTSLISLTVPACKSNSGASSFSCAQAGGLGAGAWRPWGSHDAWAGFAPPTISSSLRGAVVDIINKKRSRGCRSAQKWLECHTFFFYAPLFCA